MITRQQTIIGPETSEPTDSVRWYAAAGCASPPELARLRLVRRKRETSETLLRLIDTFDWRLARRESAWLICERNGLPHEHIRLVMPSRDVYRPIAPGLSLPAPPRPEVVKLAPDEAISKAAGSRALLVLGEGSLVRETADAVDHNGKVVARVQELVITARDGTDPAARLLGLTPLRGFARLLPPTDVTQAAVRVVESLAATRGRRPFDYDQALRLDLSPGDTVGAVHDRVVGHLRSVCRWNEAGIVQRLDVEFLHDFRVALRRLRSYLNAVAHADPEGAESLIRQLWDFTGRARDLDVFADHRAVYVSRSAGPLRPDVEAVFDQVDQWRTQAYARLSLELQGDVLDRLDDALARTRPERQESPARDLAVHLMKRREKRFAGAVKRLVAQYEQCGEDIADDQIHATRIQAKKRRYVAEIFGTLAPNEVRSRPMRTLQNLLGSYNDLVVEEALFHSILAERPVELEHLLAAIGYMLATVAAQKRAARHQVMLSLKKEVS